MHLPSTDMDQASALQDFSKPCVSYRTAEGSMHNISQLSLDFAFLEVHYKTLFGEVWLGNSKLRNCFTSFWLIVWLASTQNDGATHKLFDDTEFMQAQNGVVLSSVIPVFYMFSDETIISSSFFFQIWLKKLILPHGYLEINSLWSYVIHWWFAQFL